MTIYIRLKANWKNIHEEKKELKKIFATALMFFSIMLVSKMGHNVPKVQFFNVIGLILFVFTGIVIPLNIIYSYPNIQNKFVVTKLVLWIKKKTSNQIVVA